MADLEQRIREIGERTAAAGERINDACARAGRDPAGVTLVAVTKGHDADTVRAAVSAGLRDLGESRVQETRSKRGALDSELPPGVRWHLVGQLQSNKARVAAGLYDVIHSLDSTRLATSLARHRGASSRLRVLLEVELTGIAGRGGVARGAVDDLLLHTRRHPELDVVGLMTVAAPTGGTQARATFASLRTLRDELVARHGAALPQLSMGMSDDYEAAVEEGATMVRLGRTLFGERQP